MIDPKNSQRLNRESCFRYLTEKIFTIRSASQEELLRGWPGKVGIELEMQPFRRSSDDKKIPSIMPLSLQSQSKQENNIFQILSELANRKGWKAEYFDVGAYQTYNGEKIVEKFVIGDNEAITFEPGGQVEFSTKPFYCLDAACQQLKTVLDAISNQFEKYKCQIVQVGLNPWFKLTNSPLQMTKQRYLAMDEYFMRHGSGGQEMMRQSMSIQVNLDFGFDLETGLERYLGANLISPFATALFAFSPFKEGKKTTLKTNRADSWLRLDETRTGFPLKNLVNIPNSIESCVESYLNFALQSRVIYIEGLDYKVPPFGFTFQDWMEKGLQDVYPTEKDFALHLTLLFPEVRPKGFLEIRAPDCQSPAWQNVPAIFYCGLLYSKRNLKKIISELGEDFHLLEELWYKAPYGLKEKKFATTAKKIMDWASEGIAELPACFKSHDLEKQLFAFNENFTQKSRTPADLLIELVEEENNLTLATLRKFEDISLKMYA
ncbi:MAG: hypothetical protein KBD78_07635 [Oligoflexales bacterium]|nr:hypothetical protein [Oligoflexales bacterium]